MILRIFKRGELTFSALPAMVGSSDQADVDFLIYTDDSYEVEFYTGGLGAVVIDKLNPPRPTASMLYRNRLSLRPV